MDRWVLRTERAAGFFLAVITCLTFINVLLRNVFGFAIPDGFDISRLMLAVTIFWGIASTGYRNEHIQVDVLWQACGPEGRRAMDLVATAISLGFIALLGWMLLAGKVPDGIRSGEATFDLRLPVWPFHLIAALGILFATILLVIRLVRLLRPVRPSEAR
jgi:TRAP-type C4-dicarboxylate transport system permease small subunit